MNVSALIVTFNRLDKLKDTVMATRKLPFQHIIIVNNASTDGTTEWLNCVDDPRIVVLHKLDNNGGAGGFRYGAEYISKKIQTDWVLFYDDDAYPRTEFLQRFEDSNPKADEIYCAVVKNKLGEICKMNLPWKKSTYSCLDNIRYLIKPSKFVANPDLSSEVISFSFVGVIIHAKVLSETYDYIKPELFIYYDDVYYSSYLKYLGHKINFSTNLEFVHDVKMFSCWDSQEWKIYYLARNLFLSQSLYDGFECFSRIAKCLRITKYFLSGFNCKDKRKYYGYLFKGILHGMQGISGCNH